ncbi:hypothetical protein NMU03_05100 [Allocoprobacillus halotolerans]|uniref:Uncharacterized protein n=1 Tax=Allocoprobacillus halotolerans TaxID=2944914 RepID=A0ABY5I497_9FIRM|nr:hypothetical protein [Allocoprobacillus halotolerans]UTY40178.1 hypothetical protein NMU03_05100 [Allocoprobacillus halotolerans]
MFEYESEIIIAIRGSQEPALERIIKDTKEVYNLCNEIKQLLAITGNIMLNVFIAVSIILIVFFIFFIQQHIYPLAFIFFIFAAILVFLVVFLRLILSVDASNWIDCLRDDEAFVMNRFLKSQHIQIELKDQTILKYLKHRHKKEIVVIDEEK